MLNVSVFISSLMFAEVAFAGLMTVDGRERGYWDKGKHSVVYAIVAGIEERPEPRFETGTHLVTLHPQATLTGDFDAGRHPEITTSLWVSGFTSSVHVAPKVGSFVVVVLRRTGEDYIIPSDITLFMPGKSSIVEVNGFSDPRVQKLIETLQSLRTESEEERRRRSISPFD